MSIFHRLARYNSLLFIDNPYDLKFAHMFFHLYVNVKVFNYYNNLKFGS